VIPAHPRRARDNINLRPPPSLHPPAPRVSCPLPVRRADSGTDAGALSRRQREMVLGFGVAGSRVRGMKHRAAPWDRASDPRAAHARPFSRSSHP